MKVLPVYYTEAEALQACRQPARPVNRRNPGAGHDWRVCTGPRMRRPVLQQHEWGPRPAGLGWKAFGGVITILVTVRLLMLPEELGR